MAHQYFITGIGTNVGKTLVSAIFCQAYAAHYYKPIQAGELTSPDALTVQNLVTAPINFYDSTYNLHTPASPHLAAQLDGVTINLANIHLPTTTHNLIVEGAGGVLVPINETETTLALIIKLNLPVVLVSQHYLGSINHTLLTYEMLCKHNIPVKGIVFNGTPNPSSEAFILNYTQLPCLLRIAQHDCITPQIAEKYAQELLHS
ncbi:MAG: dethiobiotin synthase [Bacteroidia bacterium]